VLQPVHIRNPYAERLKIPKEVFKPRRTNAHYLAFIEVVTFYHQYQREKQYDQDTGEEYIETTLEDITEANKLLKEVLLRKSDLLTGACRNYFEGLKDHLRAEDKTSFTNKEIRQVLRTKATTLKRYHGQLLEAGLIRVKAGKRYKGYEYEITNQEEYQKLRDDIGSVLDEIVKQIEQPTSPPVAHQPNGQAKRKKSS
jgi:predicted transcriptional regulator